MKAKKASMYIDNKELEHEIQLWRCSSEDPKLRIPSERLGQLMILMHKNILRHRNFSGYSFDLKEEMMSYSLYRIFKCGLLSFKQGKAKAFSYFTRAIFTNYITCICKYYKRLNDHQEYIKGELMKHSADCQQLESFISRFRASNDDYC